MSASMGYFYPAGLAPRVSELLASQTFDLIFVHCSSMAQYMAHVRGAPTVTGSVPDVRPYVRRSALVAPLNIARGTQNKILEAMAMGVPVVASSVAAGGVDAVPEQHFLTANNHDERAAAVLRLLEYHISASSSQGEGASAC